MTSAMREEQRRRVEADIRQEPFTNARDTPPVTIAEALARHRVPGCAVANIAMQAAATETRVLVIDANMRRPSLHSIFKLGEGPGLGEVASNFAGVSPTVKWLAVFGMLVGRLEVFPLLVLFTPTFWRH